MQRLGDDTIDSLDLEGDNNSDLLQYDPGIQALSSPTLLDPYTITSLPPVASNLNQLLSTAPSTISALVPGEVAGNTPVNVASTASAFGSLGAAIASLFGGTKSTTAVAATPGKTNIAGYSVSTSTLEIGAVIVGVLLLVAVSKGHR